MKRLGNLEDGRRLTTGEKALVVMLVAGVFGYWAGFNLSAPGWADPFPVTSAAAQSAAPAPPAASPADRRAAGAVQREGRTAPTF